MVFFQKNLMMKIFKSSKSLVNNFDKILKDEKINEIFIYNGRRHNTRPLLRLANQKKIKLNNLEHVTFLNNTKGVRQFKNYMPNDLIFLKKEIIKHWKKNRGNNEDVKKYFLYRKNNLLKIIKLHMFLIKVKLCFLKIGMIKNKYYIFY